MVWRYKLQFTDKTLTLRKCMYMRASELMKFFAFSHSKAGISFNIFVGTSPIPRIRNIFNFRCQITSAYIYNQCSFRLLLMVWFYTNGSIPTNTNIEHNVCAVRAELRKLWLLYILKLPFLSIFCRYISYFVGTNDMLVGLHVPTKFPNVPTKLRKSIIGGGGGQLPPCPPPLWLR